MKEFSKKLFFSDSWQNWNQMKNRGNGLIDFDLLKNSTEKINKRPLLVNEFELDVAGKTPKELFYSWVFANGLR